MKILELKFGQDFEAFNPLVFFALGNVSVSISV